MFLACIQVFVAFLATRLHSGALLEAESVYIHKILSGCMSSANVGHVPPAEVSYSSGRE